MTRNGLILSLLTGVILLCGCQTPTPTAASQNSPLRQTLRPQAVEILKASLRDENPMIRIHAIEAAAETQHKDAMAEIMRMMGDEAVAIRFAAVTAAGDMACFGCEQEVRRRLIDPDENVRLAAAYTLVKFNYRDFHSSLRQAANAHDDSTVRANAVLLLGKVGNQEDLDLLYKVMRDDHADDKVRFQAIESIARLKDTRLYRSKLWSLLISKYADDRVMGIRAMGALGDQDSKNAIMTMLSDDVLEVRLAAAEQLGRLGDRSGCDEVAAYLALNPDFNQPDMATLLAIMAIGRIGTPELTAHLPAALNSRSAMTRLTAAQSVLLLTR